ncbi:MAG: hypothetical protein J5738_01970 [Lachnospiraceae bacterium]|nr:hypothetical protein [Lachnospiraceae bacterium]
MRKIKLFLVLVIVSTCLSGCMKKKINVAEIIGTDQMNVDTYRAEFVIDENDIRQVTTYASYVFVAEVTDYVKTKYLDDYADSPVTWYKIRVKENIKGNLKKDENIVLTKAGGLRRGTNLFLICKEDILPRVGDTYLFSAVIFEDELYCPMPNMVVRIPNSENAMEDPNVKRYEKACSNPTEEVPDGSRYKSKYDAGEG